MKKIIVKAHVLNFSIFYYFNASNYRNIRQIPWIGSKTCLLTCESLPALPSFSIRQSYKKGTRSLNTLRTVRVQVLLLFWCRVRLYFYCVCSVAEKLRAIRNDGLNTNAFTNFGAELRATHHIIPAENANMKSKVRLRVTLVLALIVILIFFMM